MSANEIHLNDVGTVFEATIMDGAVVVNISAATIKQLTFKGQSGSSKTKSATFATDGTDGKLRYVTVVGDLDWAGQWELQAYVVMPTGAWHSDTAQFIVYENL
jgi:hypothetical protein